MKVDLRYDDAAVVAALNRLRVAAADMRPAMREVAATLEDAAEEAFASQSSPAGTPWAVPSASTKARRAKRGTWPGRVLQESGGRGLAGSVSSDYGGDYGVAGTNKVYAGTHQFGADKGAFGSTRRGQPIPFGDIPARPFLRIGRERRRDILDPLNAHSRGLSASLLAARTAGGAARNVPRYPGFSRVATPTFASWAPPTFVSL